MDRLWLVGCRHCGFVARKVAEVESIGVCPTCGRRLEAIRLGAGTEDAPRSPVLGYHVVFFRGEFREVHRLLLEEAGIGYAGHREASTGSPSRGLHMASLRAASPARAIGAVKAALGANAEEFRDWSTQR